MHIALSKFQQIITITVVLLWANAWWLPYEPEILFFKNMHSNRLLNAKEFKKFIQTLL
jgi:hypothetical protein